MKPYNPDEPLIFIHVPKTAGVTTRHVVQEWFGDRLVLHYYNEKTGKLPRKHILSGNGMEPKVVYGHFNSRRGFGVRDYYPEVSQFITILRDPFEMAISTYYYLRQAASGWRDASRRPEGSLVEYLRGHRLNMLDHFPEKLTMENYRDVVEAKFVAIGVTEHLAESLSRIAARIGKAFNPASLPWLNSTGRDQQVNDLSLRDRFLSRHPVEYAVYQHALRKFQR